MNTEANMSQESHAAPAQALVAVMAPLVSTELRLKGKSPLRRNLDLRASSYGYLSAVLYIAGSKAYRMTSLAYANEKIADCRLDIGKDGQISFALWLNHAAFDVSAAEARQIREKFEPMGLRVTAL
jgi:hypothetical protein